MTSVKVFFILCALVLCFVVSQSDDHIKCKHDEINHDPEFLDIDEDFPEPDEEGRRLASASKIRIYPYYNYVGGSSSYESYFKNRLIPPVVSYFEGALKVKYPVSGNLRVSSGVRSVCGKSTPSILHAGIPADFFIFFTSTSDSGSWIAESTTCYLASGTNRPLISNTLVNRKLLKDAGSDILLHEKNMYLIIHEMTHTFGFSYSLYRYFLDSNGRRRSGHISSKKLDGRTSVVVNVSPLTTRLRNHFGCSSLAGAYMENSGSTATAGSHFERRQFGFEALTSGLTYRQRISEFTLAMLEGSGWYVPDYDYAEPFYFGQGQGCTFLTGTCSSKSFQFEELCKGSSRGCAPQGGTGGRCSDDVRSDGCKFVHANVDYDCQNPRAASYARLSSLQSFGRNAESQCFSGTLSSKSGAKTSSFCFKYSCSGSGSGAVVKVQVGSHSISCTKQGSVSVPGYRGTINCPDPLSFCRTIGKEYCPRNCMGRGSCINGKCQCYSGHSGIDCAL